MWLETETIPFALVVLVCFSVIGFSRKAPMISKCDPQYGAHPKLSEQIDDKLKCHDPRYRPGAKATF